jgi:flavin-dependent dehydrogenase
MSQPDYSPSETWDAIVVGASFAGLAFAGAAAARGMRVLVLEQDPTPGGVVRTTGVLFSDVLDVLDVPARYLMNAVRRLHIQAPGQTPLEIGGRAWRFYMADVTGMLGWMAECAREHGAEVRCATPFVDAERAMDGRMRVRFGGAVEGQRGPSRAPQGEAYARLVVGADGAHSLVAQRLGLERNTRFLAGAEWLVEGVPLDGETFYLVMDHALAPGYCLWLAPHGEIAALGVAGRQREFKPNDSLQAARAIFGEVADLSQMRVRERKAGIIPIGGQLRQVYRQDAVGHALLLGDAAGLCGAATGGGIYPALISGRLAAHAAANEILNGTEGAIRAYLRDLPQAGRLGHYLRIENWLRVALNHAGSNADLSAFYGIFATPEGKRVLQRTLFETPIISMDSSFFALLRTLLGKRPALYGSALRAAWQRVLARG